MIPINTQPAEKQQLTGPLQVHSIFYTIQGEGPFCGQPAVFVRLAGCNLQCPKCDTDYTGNREFLTVDEIIEGINSALRHFGRLQVDHNQPIVVITGGEPFRQDIGHLVRMLVSKNYRVQIETNGTLYVPDLPWDSITVVCSPKTGKINQKLLPRIDAFKYVLRAGDMCADGLPQRALDHTAAPVLARPPVGNLKPVYLQPLDEQDNARNQANLNACIQSCMTFGYTLQLQIHKIINLE